MIVTHFSNDRKVIRVNNLKIVRKTSSQVMCSNGVFTIKTDSGTLVFKEQYEPTCITITKNAIEIKGNVEILANNGMNIKFLTGKQNVSAETEKLLRDQSRHQAPSIFMPDEQTPPSSRRDEESPSTHSRSRKSTTLKAKAAKSASASKPKRDAKKIARMALWGTMIIAGVVMLTVAFIGRKLDAKKQQEPQPKPVASKTF